MPVMQRSAITVCLTAAACALPAQAFTDTFPTDTGKAPPGWTAQAGKWQVVGGRLVTDATAMWAYITVDGYKPTNGVIDLEAFYTAAGTQFAGAVGRYASPTYNVLCKVQENSVASQDFDRSFVIERVGSSQTVWRDLSTKVTGSCTVRFIVVGGQLVVKHDFDGDGVFDQTIAQTATRNLGAGLVGATIWGASGIDNFEFHDAVLQPAPGATPKIGTSFRMELTTTARTPTPWLVVLSGGNSGFAIGSRRIPLDLDPILDVSLQLAAALGLAGTTDARGVASPTLRIPNDPYLVGFKHFAAAITIDGAKPFSIDNISNEIAIAYEQ